MESTVEEAGTSRAARDHESRRIFVDNCDGILQEVPDSFDFGTLKVRLRSLRITRNFLSFGSECGALFLFSRKYGRALKPLRTTWNEVVTCQQWFSEDERDFLAVGHQSGTLILIQLPSGKAGGNRKLKQSIHEGIHKERIAAVCWTPDGRFLFSADVGGLILCVRVDFDEEIYTTQFVHQSAEPIRFLRVSATNLIAASARSFAVFATSAEDFRVVVERELPRATTGFTIHDEKHVLFALEDARLLRVGFESGTEEFVADLSENVHRLPLLPAIVVVGGTERELVRPVWTIEDFKHCTTVFYEEHLLLFSTDKIQLFRVHDGLKTIEQRFILDLRLQLKNSELLTIDDAVFDAESAEIFVLSSTQKLLRLAAHPPADELIRLQDERASIFSSLSTVAQKSSKRWFNKFASAGEFQPFVAPNLPANLRILPVESVEEYRTKITTNLSNVLGQFRPFGGDEKPADEREEAAGGGEDERQEAEEIVEHKPVECFETRVEVRRRTRARRGGKSSSRGGDSERHAAAASTLPPASPTDGDDDAAATVEVDERNLDKLFGVLGLAPMPPESPKKSETEDAGEERVEGGAVEDGVVEGEAMEREDDKAEAIGSLSSRIDRLPTPTRSATPLNEEEDNGELRTESEASDREDEAEAAEPKSLEEAVQRKRLESPADDQWAHVPSTSSARSSADSAGESAAHSTVFSPTNAEYEVISRLANHRTDVWSRIKLPFAATWFDACGEYMIVCSSKKSKRPHYRRFDAVDNPILGVTWTSLKYDATVVAINDTGNLLWRVDDGVAYAPLRLESSTPFSSMWIEQANEGRIEAVALTKDKAWYLTNKGVSSTPSIPFNFLQPFVQMELPEMGILFHAEAPFRFSQIAASERAVWALRANTGALVVRVGLKHCPMGVDWVEDGLGGPRTFVSIALFETTGFGLDFNGELWMVNGVDENRPFGVGVWQQVCSPTNAIAPKTRREFAPIQQWRLKVSSAGVFINVGKCVLSAREPLTAHSLLHCIPERMSLNDNFGLISASGFMGDTHDGVYVCQPNSEIFSYSARTRNLTSLPPFDSPAAIVALSAVRDRLFVLDASGCVHVRTHLNSWLTPRGKEWTLLEDREQTPLISFAASAQSLWAIRDDGAVLHSPLLPESAACEWTPVEKPKNLAAGEKLDQIRCSPSGHYVWAIASATCRAWARCDIGEAERRGAAWSEVPSDVRMAEWAVADNAVYAIAASNSQLHRLRALSAANPAGLYWKPLPLHLRSLSVDAFEHRVWGIDLDNRLVKHQMQIYPRSCLSTAESTRSAGGISDFSSSLSTLSSGSSKEPTTTSPSSTF
ncbi:hypothetical protein M3Y99_01828100 [Aphelenchoides fujianensis]|nr:hypothetical protein M3Y99_01828100 [Aphelenchoides fujianensis]